MMTDEKWVVFKNAKDIRHPYASCWEISNRGRVKGKQKTAGGYIWKYKEVKYETT